MKKKRWVGKILLIGSGVLLVVLLTAGCATYRGVVSAIRFWDSPEPKSAEFFAKIRESKGNLDTIYSLACYFQDRGQHKPAIEEFRRILKADPTYVKAYNGMGVSYDLMGQYPRAIQSYQTALALNPDLDYVYNNIGFSYLLQGKTEAAIEAFEKAVSLNNREKRYRNNLARAKTRENKAAYAEAAEPEPAFHSEELAAAAEAEETKTTAASRLEESAGVSPMPVDAPAGKIGADKLGNLYSAVAEVRDSDALQSLTVEVSNGNGVSHMARLVREYLEKEGLESLLIISNADHFGYEKTAVYYLGEGRFRTAAEIAKLIPGWQEITESPELKGSRAEIRVVLGKDMIPYRQAFARPVSYACASTE